MIAKIYVKGEIGVDCTLLSVMAQFGAFENPVAVEVYIDSLGGGVAEGNAIYDYLKKLPIPVKTIATRAYSIAANVFMAGEIREVQAGSDKLMIHFPFVQKFSGRAPDLAEMSKVMKNLENEMLSFH